MTALSLEEAQAGMVDRLVRELDPRVNDTHRAFFARLRPETADAIAEFHARWVRAALKIAMAVRSAVQVIHDETESGDVWMSHEDNNAVCALLSDSTDHVSQRGFAAIEPTLRDIRAFRGDDEDALILSLNKQIQDLCMNLVTDNDFYGDELVKQSDLAHA